MDMAPWPEKDNTERWPKPWCFLILCKKQPGQWEGCELWIVDLGGWGIYSLLFEGGFLPSQMRVLFVEIMECQQEEETSTPIPI